MSPLECHGFIARKTPEAFWVFLSVFFFGFGGTRVLNSALHTCTAGAPPLGGHTSSPFCSGCFWRWGLENYFPGLASNLNLPTLPSGQDYRCELWCPAGLSGVDTQ
jgi:hypothetical protein